MSFRGLRFESRGDVPHSILSSETRVILLRRISSLNQEIPVAKRGRGQENFAERGEPAQSFNPQPEAQGWPDTAMSQRKWTIY